MNNLTKIRDWAEIFDVLNPIKISINGEVAWDDNIDLTCMSEAEAIDATYQNMDRYNELMARDDKVISVTFNRVMNHHTEVNINTEAKS